MLDADIQAYAVQLLYAKKDFLKLIHNQAISLYNHMVLLVMKANY